MKVLLCAMMVLCSACTVLQRNATCSTITVKKSEACTHRHHTRLRTYDSGSVDSYIIYICECRY